MLGQELSRHGNQLFEVLLVDSKVLVVEHVFVVQPHTLDRDILFNVRDSVHEVVLELQVATGSRVEAQSVHWRQSWLADDAVVLLDDVSSSSLEHEVHFEVATDCDVAKSGSIGASVSNDWGHGVGVSEVDTKEVSFLRALDEGEWMNSTALLATCSIIVLRVSSIGPHGPGSFIEVELVDSLSETVDTSRWELEINLKVLVHHHDL